MNQLIIGIYLTVLLLPAQVVYAGTAGHPKNIIGTLSCKIVRHSGLDLLIHSTRNIHCTFTPSDGGPVEQYKGETGIKFGLDVNINRRESITYSVLADHFKSGGYQLAGKYSGAGGVVSFGLALGDSVPIQKQGRNITLQPILAQNSGAGAAAGLTYLYLEADSQ